MAFDNHNSHQSVAIGPASAATLSNQTASDSNATLLSANNKRTGVIIHNDSSASLYVKYGAAASSSSYTYKLLGAQTWEMPDPVYTGQIDGIWDSATGTARITELN